eukprot:gene907-4748_t
MSGPPRDPRTARAVASSYTAELHAIREALRRLRGLLPAGPVRVLLATDSQSAVRALCGGPAAQHGTLEQEVWRLLRSIFHGDRELILQWVSAHCELKWNDVADTCAQEGARRPQQTVPIPFATAAAAIRRAAAVEWARQRQKIFTDWAAHENRPHWYAALPRPPHRRDEAEGPGDSSGGWHSVAALLRHRMPRNVERVVRQMRAGKTYICADYTGGLGWTTLNCPRCGAAQDGVRHLLLECSNEKLKELRRRHLGFQPTLR